MLQVIKFIRDCLADLTVMLQKFTLDFGLGGMNPNLLEVFIGFIALGLIIAVFWKGSRV